MTLFKNVRAESTLMALVIGMIAIFGSIIILSVIFGGVLDSSSSQTNLQTTAPTEASITTMSPVVTQTRSPSKTPTATQAPTLTPTPTPTPTATPSPTVTPTPDPYTNEKYSEFVSTVFGETKVDADLPVRLRGWEVVEGEVLIIATNLTASEEDSLRRVRQVNTLVSSGYAQAVFHYDNGNIDGKLPNRLRIAEVNNTGSEPKTLYVNTSLARDYYLNELTPPEFSKHYWKTKRNMTAEEEQYIRKIDEGAENVTLYNETAE